jgi:serine/threonine protein kinase
MDDASLSSPGPLTILEGMRFAGRYELGPEIGRGGMGRVHRARDLVLGEDVALKFLHLHLVDDQLNRKRFLREVRLARHVSHPSVCRVHDVGEADGRLYLSMELVRGRDLAAMLREDGPLELERARRFATQLCAGLAAIHAQGVLHRDLKPGNLLIDAQDGLRITDFGVASLEQDEDEADGIKRGTVTYMAPEQLAGHAPNVQTDLFALGCVLYELYTGEQLYRVQTLDELNARHRDQACRASECRPGIPPDVDASDLGVSRIGPAATSALDRGAPAGLARGGCSSANRRGGSHPEPRARQRIDAARPRSRLPHWPAARGADRDVRRDAARRSRAPAPADQAGIVCRAARGARGSSRNRAQALGSRAS